MAKKHGLELIDRQTFKDYFDKNKNIYQNKKNIGHKNCTS